MRIRRPLTTFAWAMLLAGGLVACGAAPSAAPGAPAAPTSTEAAVATVAPALLPTASALPAPDVTAPALTPPSAPAMPMPVATLPVIAATTVATVPTELGGAGLILPQEALAGIVSDLAGRLKVAPGAISLVSAEAVEWSDGSLGCPQPGMMYPQVITEGVRVILSADGKQYAYHGDGQGKLFYCENPARS